MQRRKLAANRNDVAKLAKVAPSTVSLVLNNTPGPSIPDGTRQRIMDAARALGYSSSSVARALVTGRTHTVGVAISFMERPFFRYSARILDGFWMALHPMGYRMLMVPGSSDAAVAGLYRERSVDGIISLAAACGAADAELLSMAESGFPCIFVGSKPLAVQADYIDIDNVATAREATAGLIRAGHREILHLAGPLDVNSAAIDRRDGFLLAMREAGLPVRDDAVLDCSFNLDLADERLGRAMDGGLRFSAIFAGNLGMAQGALRRLRARGLRVPADVSLAAIDVDDESSRNGDGICTFDQPLEAIGRRAGEALVERMHGMAGPPRRILMPCVAVPGSSIAAPST